MKIAAFFSFFVSLMVFSVVMADCMVPKMDTCLKMKTVSSDRNWLLSIVKFKSLCNVEFAEVNSGKLWRALLAGCPEISGEQYVYLKYKCDDTTIVPHPASLLLMKQENCTPILESREKKYAEFNRIKAGMKTSELHKFGLTKLRLGNSDKIWKYQADPGYIVEIEVAGLICNERVCDDENIQTVKNVTSIRDEYLGSDKLPE